MRWNKERFVEIEDDIIAGDLSLANIAVRYQVPLKEVEEMARNLQEVVDFQDNLRINRQRSESEQIYTEDNQ